MNTFMMTFEPGMRGLRCPGMRPASAGRDIALAPHNLCTPGP